MKFNLAECIFVFYIVKKIIIYFIVVLTSIFCNELKAQLNFNFQDVIADSQYLSIKDKYNAALNQHPLIIEKKSVVAGTIKIRKSENRTLAFFITMLLLFVFAGIKNIFFKHFTNLYRVFTTFNISKRQMKEQLENNTRASAFFLVIYILCMSYLFFILLKDKIGSLNKFTYSMQFLYFLLIVTIAYFLKLLFSKMIAWIFNELTIFQEYQFTNNIINEFTGLFLFPICIFLILVKGNIFSTLLILGISLVICMEVFKYIRLMGIVKKLLRIDFLHFFMYICAFEILPLLVLIKLAR